MSRREHDDYAIARALPIDQRTLSRIAEAIAEGVVIIDREGRIVFANAAAERVLGRPRDDIIGRLYNDPAWSMTTVEGAPFPEDEQPFQRVMRAGAPVYDVEQVVETAAGRRTIVSINSAPIFDEAGALAGTVTSFRDMTQIRADEAALRRSTERYRRLVEMAPDVIYSIAVDSGTITSLNPAFEELTGWRVEDWIGRSFAGLVHPDDLPLAIQNVTDVRAGRTPPPYELRIRARSGAYLVGEFRSAPQIEDGRIVGKFGIARDITERKRWEAERLRRAEEFRVLAENVPDIIARFDRDLRHIYVNRAIEQVVGLPTSALIGKTNAEIEMPPELVRHWHAALRHVFETGEESILEFDFPTPAGKRHYQSRLVPERAGDGSISHVLGITRDITQHEVIEERFRFLAQASVLLAQSLDQEATLRQLTELLVPRLADWCGIDLIDAEGRIQRAALAHRDRRKQVLAEVTRQRSPSEDDESSPIIQAIRSGRTVTITRVSEAVMRQTARDEQQLAMLRELDPVSVVVVPLITRGTAIGAITLVIEQPRPPYTEDDVALVEELATRAAQAIDNARLYQLSQEAERQARRQTGRVRALSEASRTFAEATLDFQQVLGTIARTVASQFGGLCIIRLISADGRWLEPAAVYHEDPEAIALISALMDASPQRIDEGVLGRVARTGQSFILPTVQQGDLRAYIKPEYWPFHERFGLRGVMVVPLWARGRLIGTLGVFRDATDEPFTEEDQSFLHDLADRAALSVDNARLYQQTQEAVRAREEFISIASHELKTPLTTIRGYNQILLRQVERMEPNAERVRAVAYHLWEQTSRLEALVTDLLDSSRIQQGRLGLRPQRFDIVELAREVLERFEHDPDRTLAHLLELSAESPVEGVWDRARIDQVLTNLISNAIKYSPEGGHVCLTIRSMNGLATISVRDEGIGILPEDQPTLFQPFSRGGGNRRDVSGTGLGLYITAQIVERHGGTITLESTPGAGSTFTVQLPLEPPATPDQADG